MSAPLYHCCLVCLTAPLGFQGNAYGRSMDVDRCIQSRCSSIFLTAYFNPARFNVITW